LSSNKTIPARRSGRGLIIIGGIAAALLIAKLGKDFIDKFNFNFLGFGFPSTANDKILLPIKLLFTNDTSLTVDFESVSADVFMLKPTGYELIAQVSQPVTIPPGTSLQTVTPAIDAYNIFGDILSSAASIIGSGTISIRTDVRVWKFGIPFPKQSFTDQINVNPFKR
jgi:hypothetical protein